MATNQAEEWFARIPGPPPPRRRSWMWMIVGALLVASLVAAALMFRGANDGDEEQRAPDASPSTGSPSPSVSRTETPRLGSSPQPSQIAAAEDAQAAYRQFVAVVDEVLADGGRDVGRYKTVATGAALTLVNAEAASFRADAERATGITSIAELNFSAGSADESGVILQVKLDACLDVRDAGIIDRGGKDVSPAGRAAFFRSDVTVTRAGPTDTWKVENFTLTKVDRC